MPKNVLCYFSDGTEHQNFYMVPENMMKELISGNNTFFCNLFFK